MNHDAKLAEANREPTIRERIENHEREARNRLDALMELRQRFEDVLDKPGSSVPAFSLTYI